MDRVRKPNISKERGLLFCKKPSYTYEETEQIQPHILIWAEISPRHLTVPHVSITRRS
jgi:hypothetical protein